MFKNGSTLSKILHVLTGYQNDSQDESQFAFIKLYVVIQPLAFTTLQNDRSFGHFQDVRSFSGRLGFTM